MQPNEVLAKQYHVPDLKEGEVAQFMLLNAGKLEAGREHPSRPEVYQLSKECIVNNPATSQPVKIGNVISWESHTGTDGKPWTKAVTKGPQFIRGLLTLTSDQNSTYQYLMRRKDNISNPFAKLMGGRGKFVFKLADDRKEINDQLLLADLRYEAEKLIRETREPLKLQTIAARLNQSPDKRLHIMSYNPPVSMNAQAIKLELIQKVSLFAKQILYAGEDQGLKVRIQLMEAMTWGVLLYVNDGFHVYVKKELKLMHTPAEDEEKVASLAEFCMTEKGKVAYAEICNALKTAQKVNV